MSVLPPSSPGSPAPGGAPPAPLAAPRPGRGLVVAGAVLLVLAVVGGTVGTMLASQALDLESLDRDVVVDGSPTAIVPGTIDFEVQAPLDPGDEADMTVGVAVARRSGEVPVCRMRTAAGEEVGGSPLFGTELIDPPSSRFEVEVAARLSPGSYRAECAVPADTGPTDAEFTVGRVFGREDVDGLIGPALGVLGALGVAGLVGVVGLVLLIVGLVRGNRSSGAGPPPGGAPWVPPAGWQQPPTRQPPQVPQQPPTWQPPPGPPSGPPWGS